MAIGQLASQLPSHSRCPLANGHTICAVRHHKEGTRVLYQAVSLISSSPSAQHVVAGFIPGAISAIMPDDRDMCLTCVGKPFEGQGLLLVADVEMTDVIR